jgi:hypothetical protein
MIILKSALFVLLVLVNSACAAEECIFSPEYFTENDYKSNQTINTYKWSNANKEIKGVLNNGHLFSVKHWSCTHNGTHAVLYVGPSFKVIPDTINKYIFQLANIALNKEDIKLLSKAISGKNLSIPSNSKKILIPNNEYSEFYISYSVVGEIIVIEIKLYQG